MNDHEFQTPRPDRVEVYEVPAHMVLATPSRREHGVKIIHDTRTCATCFLLAVPECASDDFNAQADKLLGEVDK